MAWRIEIDDKAKKELAGLDKTQAKRITTFLHKRVAELDDPRSIGEALKGSKFGDFWKYRVGRLPDHCQHRGWRFADSRSANWQPQRCLPEVKWS